MNNYPAPRINQALGIDPGASLDDALTAIAQLRASVADAHNWSPAFQRMAEFLYAMAGPQLARAPATPFTPAGLEQLCELTSAAVSDRVRELRQTLHGLQHDRDALRAELKQADEALADTQRDLETARATLADMARIRRAIEADVRKTEQARDAAFAALHHATAAYL